MKLTEDLKQQIDAWFENKSAEEVEAILKSYGLKEEHSYTLDEMRSEVDKFKDYISEVCRKNECGISVEFEYYEDVVSYHSKLSHIKTRIIIGRL